MATAPARPAINPWLVLAILLAIYVLNYADRYMVAGLAETLKAEFRLSDSFLGLLLGPAFAVLFTTLSIPLARLADRHSRVLILSAGCLLWSLFTMLSGLAGDRWMLAATRVGVGIGEAAFIAPAYSVLADRFGPEQRGKAFAILGLGIYFGQIGGYIGGPALAALHGWRMAFLLMGAPGILLALLTVLLIREPLHRAPAAAAAGGGERLLGIWRRLMRLDSYRDANLGMALGTLSGFSFGMWGPALFVRAYDIPLVTATKAFGSAFGTAGLIGMLSFGFLSDRLSRRGLQWPFWLSAGALFAATASIACVTYAPNLQVATLLAIPAGMLGGGWSIGVMASLQNLLSDRIRATATALFLLVTTFTGMVFGPYLVGLLSDGFGGGLWGLRLAVILAVLTGFPGAFLLWRAARAFARDSDHLAQAATVQTISA